MTHISTQEETKINTVERTCEDTINIQNNPIQTPQNSNEKTYKEDFQMTFYRSYEESSLEMTNLPERTIHRSFPLDYIETTLWISNEPKKNSNLNKSNSFFSCIQQEHYLLFLS